MKKIILLVILALIVAAALLFLKKNTRSLSQLVQETNQVLSPSMKIDLVTPASNSASITTISQPTNPIEPISNSINALTATNLEQWKAMIKGLHKSPGFKISEYWDMELTNRTDGTPVHFEENGKTISYKVGSDAV